MSIHSNLKLLLENIDNPELFNLYLENPKDIILNIIKNNNITLFLRLYNEYKNYKVHEYNERLQWIPIGFKEDKCKWFIDNLFNFPLNDIFTFVLSKSLASNSYLKQKIIEHKDKIKFNDIQKEFICRAYPNILKIKKDINRQIISDFNVQTYDIIHKKYKNKFLIFNDNDLQYYIDSKINDKIYEYYKKWIIELIEYLDILNFEQN